MYENDFIPYNIIVNDTNWFSYCNLYIFFNHCDLFVHYFIILIFSNFNLFIT
jgi:hypothetical protein